MAEKLMLTIEEKQFRAQLIHELKRLNNILEKINSKLDGDTNRNDSESPEI